MLFTLRRQRAGYLVHVFSEESSAREVFWQWWLVQNRSWQFGRLVYGRLKWMGVPNYEAVTETGPLTELSPTCH